MRIRSCGLGIVGVRAAALPAGAEEGLQRRITSAVVLEF